MSDQNSIITTDAELQAQFNERNKNLKNSLSNVVDKIDQAATKTQDYLHDSIDDVAQNDSHFEQEAPDISGGFADQRLMSSIRHDIEAMHSTNPDIAKDLASKFEETFAHNALP